MAHTAVADRIVLDKWESFLGGKDRSSCDRTAHRLSRVPAGFATTRDFISIRCAFSRYLSAVRSLFFLLHMANSHISSQRVKKQTRQSSNNKTDGHPQCPWCPAHLYPWTLHSIEHQPCPGPFGTRPSSKGRTANVPT